MLRSMVKWVKSKVNTNEKKSMRYDKISLDNLVYNLVNNDKEEFKFLKYYEMNVAKYKKININIKANYRKD